MVKIIHSKTETKIEADSFEIMACENKELQSFLNVFHFEGETFIQTGLGEIFGVIQVHDHSEESAYLPNLIAQVIKKEFYKNSKRTIEESFESALHKANSALAELAQHELVSWHGKLHAVIGVTHSDHFLFTQANGGKIFLIRDKKISEISKGLDDPTDNPIKTFSNVSSGTIEDGDKVIFSTESIHDLLTINDLERHVNTFSSDELDNLLKSTIESEGENVGTIVVNFNEKIISQVPKKKRSASMNYFGNDEKINDTKSKKDKIFETKKEHRIKQVASNETKEKAGEKPKEDSKKHTSALENKQKIEGKSMSPFEKQPELFIKDNEQAEKSGSPGKKKINLGSLGKGADGIFDKLKNMLAFSKIKNASLVVKKRTTELEVEKSKKILKKAKNATQKAIKPRPKSEQEEELSTEIPPIEKKEADEKTSKVELAEIFESTNAQKEEALFAASTKESSEKDKTDFKLAKFWEKDKQQMKQGDKGKLQKRLPSKELLLSGANKIVQKAKEFPSKLGSHGADRMIKNKLPLKLFGILAIAIMIAGGLYLFFVVREGALKSSDQSQSIEANNEIQQSDSVLLREEEASVEKLADLESDIIDMTFDDGEIFMLTSLNSFYRYDTHNGTLDEISIGDQIRNAEAIDTIDSLNVVVLVSSKEALSYLRVTKSFDENKIDLPEELEIIGTGSYLSYFYIFDKTSGQIYRYSRTIEKPELWLKNSLDATNATAMAIDDAIRIGYSDGRIEKYFKGKQESSFLLDTDPKIIPHKIATTIDYEYYYVLDSEQGVIAKISKNDDQIQKTYVNEKMVGAKDIYLDISVESIYFVSENAQLMKLKLN